MSKDKGKHPGIIHYSSLAAYRAAMMQPRLPGAGDSAEKGAAYESWDLGVGWDGAEKLARSGWAAGAARIAALAEKVRDALEPPEMLSPGYDVAPFGADVQLDMGRFVDGDPEHWRINVPRRSGRVSIYASVNGLGHVQASSMERRGAVALAIAWVLHDAGYEVDLRAMKVNRDSHYESYKPRSIGCTWPMSMEPSLVAYWIAHPASFRRHGFRWIEAHAPWLGSGYGATDPEYEIAAVPEGAIHLKGLTSDAGWQSDDDAIASSRKLLASLGSLDPTH